MAEVMKIAELGNPILRLLSQPVTDVADPDVQTLIDNLIHTAIQTNGVGIAAPQVAKSFQLFIVASRPNLRYLHAPIMEPTPMINPQIIAMSDEQAVGWEGCLSVPGLRGQVKRAKEVEVRWCDRYGKEHQQVFTDFVARIIQHEYDHLNGKVFIDRVATTMDLMSESEYHARVVCQ